MTSVASNSPAPPSMKTAVNVVQTPLKPQTLADNVAPAKSRFSAEMPNIPGVASATERSAQVRVPTNWRRAAVAVSAFMVLGSAGGWMMTRATHSKTAPAVPELQASPAVAELPALPAGGPANGNEIGTSEQLATPWSTKKFTYRRTLNGEQVPAIAIRLPDGNGRTVGSYWVILMKAPFGNCALEYVSDPQEIASRFGFSTTHPMIADGCSNTLYDPTRMGTLPTGAWARGEIVQGAGFRPPFQIEIHLDGNKLIAGRSEN